MHYKQDVGYVMYPTDDGPRMQVWDVYQRADGQVFDCPPDEGPTPPLTADDAIRGRPDFEIDDTLSGLDMRCYFYCGDGWWRS